MELTKQDTAVLNYKKIEQDDRIAYTADSAGLQIKIKVKDSDKLENVVFKNHMVYFDRKADAPKIAALDELLNAQLSMNDNGTPKLDGKGKSFTKAGGKNFGITKIDNFQLSIQKAPVRIMNRKGEVIEIPTDTILDAIEFMEKHSTSPDSPAASPNVFVQPAPEVTAGPNVTDVVYGGGSDGALVDYNTEKAVENPIPKAFKKPGKVETAKKTKGGK